MRTIICINILRYLVLFTSVLALAAHAIQCALYAAYKNQTTIPDWFKAGHWQYLLWYITLSVSVLSSVAICIHASCCHRSHILRGDKTLSIVNIFMLGITVLLITFLGGQEPWTNGIVEFKQPSKGFMAYCGMLNSDNDVLYPLLYHRCLLIDTTWIGACLLCLLWLILLLLSIFSKPLKRASSVGKLPSNESKLVKPILPTHRQPSSSSSASVYYQQQHNSVLTRGSSMNNYSSSTPLTQNQPLPEPTLPNVYEPDYYRQNYYEYITSDANNNNNNNSNSVMPISHQRQQPTMSSAIIPYTVYCNNSNSHTLTFQSPTTPTSVYCYDSNNVVESSQIPHSPQLELPTTDIQRRQTFAYPSSSVQSHPVPTSNQNIYYYYPQYR